MTKYDVKQFFCKLSYIVMEHFNFNVSADCFCGKNETLNYNFDKKVLEFIQDAVNEKIAREKTK